MLKLMDKDWKPIQKEIEGYLFTGIFAPLLDLLKDPIYNSVSLVTSIKTGKITYSDGVFSGTFSAKESKELSKFAIFDKRSKTWKANKFNVPNGVLAASISANEKAKALHKRLDFWLNETENRILDNVANLTFPIETATERMAKQTDLTFSKIGIEPEITPELSEKLIADYNNNQNLNIQNWEPEQIQRLRKVIEKSATQGYRRKNLIDMIQAEWGVSKNKAKFLARQETSLYMSKLRKERSLAAGVNRYKWITAKDERVRPSNPSQKKAGSNHKHLHNKIFFYGDPPVVNYKTGAKAEPGEDFGCRCVASPVI